VRVPSLGQHSLSWCAFPCDFRRRGVAPLAPVGGAGSDRLRLTRPAGADPLRLTHPAGSHPQNIYTCIYVPVMVNATNTTIPLSNIQRQFFY